MTHTISNIIDLTNGPTPPRWFEFLLGPKQQPEGVVGKLQRHLETPGCDPSPTQLISLFVRNIPSIEDNDIQIPPESYEAEYRAKKAYALQILAIKVASFLKWDLNLVCNSLTIPIQHKLMQAFANACSSKNCPAEVKKFAAILYCHWFVRTAITYRLSTLQPQTNNTTIIYLSQLQQQQQAADSSALCSMGELFAPGSKHLKTCSSELHSYIWEFTHNNKDNSAKKMKTSTHPFEKVKLKQPRMDCFNSWDEQDNDWDRCEWIESKEFMEAACYDLGRYFFFEESYELAKLCFEIIKDSHEKFSKLTEYFESATDMLSNSEEQNGKMGEAGSDLQDCDFGHKIKEKRQQTEKYLFECMTQFSQNQKKETEMDVDENDIDDEDDFEEDLNLKLNQQNQHSRPDNAWYLQVPPNVEQQQMLEAAKGDVFMSQGNFKQAMGCFIGTLMLMTDYFRIFSKNYVEEEPYISRMIQCSISLSCFTQAVALCQMTRSLNYTIAFKQLNERVCNDCCDDIYECIWDVTLLEYIINLHSKRGEVERRTRVIQLIGQLELNENNPEEILKEAEHVRRGRFFRIMSNKYL